VEGRGVNPPYNKVNLVLVEMGLVGGWKEEGKKKERRRKEEGKKKEMGRTREGHEEEDHED